MARAAIRKAASTQPRQRRTVRSRPSSTRKREFKNLIDDVTAILLISPNAKRLCEFYRATLGLPLAEEAHDGTPVRYAHSLGDVHPAGSGWPGVPTRNAQPDHLLQDVEPERDREAPGANGVKSTGPADHGFAQVISFRDPDGDSVSILEYGPEYW